MPHGLPGQPRRASAAGPRAVPPPHLPDDAPPRLSAEPKRWHGGSAGGSAQGLCIISLVPSLRAVTACARGGAQGGRGTISPAAYQRQRQQRLSQERQSQTAPTPTAGCGRVGPAASRTKEMMQPCLLYLHLISLVGRGGRWTQVAESTTTTKRHIKRPMAGVPRRPPPRARSARCIARGARAP